MAYREDGDLGGLTEAERKSIYYFALNFYYYLFLLGFIVRYLRHRAIGKYNLQDPRPRSYKLKVGLQVLMALATYGHLYDLDVDGTY